MIGPERGQKRPIRVFLVDDHAVVRDGVRRLIDDEADLTVTGEAGGGVEFLAQLATVECDVLVLDLSMPGRPGFDVLREVRAMRPDIRVLILSVYPESQYAASLLHAGAHGYLSKGRSSRQLLAAIRTVASGQVIAPPQATAALPGGLRALHEALTDRETEIFRRLAEGAAPLDIALELGLAQSTVATHVARIKDKLEVASLGEIVRYAHRHRLTE